MKRGQPRFRPEPIGEGVTRTVDTDDLAWLPAWKLRDLYAGRRLSPVEVVAHLLDRIERLDASLHSFITVAGDAAMEQARSAEQQFRRGVEPPPLCGVPVSIKDLFWTRGMRTTGGSLLYKDHVPTEDSVYAQRVLAAGGIVIGKTNTPEFGLAGRTLNRVAAECLNPWDRTRTPGGSSGGAAAATAAALCPIAIGSDAAGSIRVPSAFCGVFGLYPSYGRVPRYGGFGGSLFFSAIGPLSRDVRDAATLLQVLSGADRRDPVSRRDEPPDYLAQLDAGVAGLRLAWLPDVRAHGGAAADAAAAEVIAAVARTALRFVDLGAAVDEADVKLGIEEIEEAFWMILDADRYALIGQQLFEDAATRGLLTAYTRERFLSGRAVSAPEYVRALRVRMGFIARMESIFERYDLLLTPVVGSVAPAIGSAWSVSGSRVQNAYVIPVSFSGFAAAAVPAGLVSGLPVSLQIIAPPNREDLLLCACRALETAQPWGHLRPPGLSGGAM